MVINRDAQLFLGLLLPDDVLVEESLHLGRLGQLELGRRRLLLPALVQNLAARHHAFVADIRAGMISRRGNQFPHGILGPVAERAAR
jgi:hypothetical protein